MEFVEKQRIIGEVKVFKIFPGGRKVLHQHKKNLIVNNGKTIEAKLLGGDASYKNLEHISKIDFGDGTTPPAVADTALESSRFTKAVVTTYPAFNKVQFDTTMEGAEGGSYVYTELGLLTDATDILFSRIAITPITKSSLYKIAVEWIISFQ